MDTRATLDHVSRSLQALAIQQAREGDERTETSDELEVSTPDIDTVGAVAGTIDLPAVPGYLAHGDESRTTSDRLDMSTENDDALVKSPLISPTELLTVETILGIFPTYASSTDYYLPAIVNSANFRHSVSLHLSSMQTFQICKSRDMSIRTSLAETAGVAKPHLLENHGEWIAFFTTINKKIEWATKYMNWMELLEKEYEKIQLTWKEFFELVETKEKLMKEGEESGIRVGQEMKEVDGKLEGLVKTICEHVKKRMFLQEKIDAGADKLAWVYTEAPKWITW